MQAIEDKNQPTASPEPVSTLEGLRQSFPFPTVRHAQEMGMGAIAHAYDQRKQFTIIEAPTGSGKSPLGMAAAILSASRKEGGAHYLTSQNSLSTQLRNDFAKHGLVELRGKANYKCVQHIPQDCKTGSIMNGGRACEDCPYRLAKNYYLSGKLGVTNYTYYLTETMHSGELSPREYLIADEAHNIEREILAMVEINITQAKANDVSAGRLPIFTETEDAKVRRWVGSTYLPAAAKYLAFLNDEILQIRESGMRVPTDLMSRVQGLETLLQNLRLYMEADQPEDWLTWSDPNGTLRIKPLTAAQFAQNYLFNGTPNVLLMSATILDADTFRRNLGIKRSAAEVLALASDFPLANRRIIYWPSGSMGQKSIEQTLPLAAERIDAILRAPKFANKKGIIHSHSYKINEYLHKALGNTDHRHRIVTHSNVMGSREEAIARHIEGAGPTVLLSPSMTEGLDLKGDLSRVQIIAKVPYPFLDPYNRTRMNRDPKWYQLQTALTLVQATGRSVRDENDYATTVILDADFGRFLTQNQDILPKWWTDSIEFR
jgi:Rad3-related DNA helicase